MLRIGRMRKLRTASVLAAALLHGLYAADPDFTGEWKLDETRSTVRRSASAPCPTMRVEHADGKLIATGLFQPCGEPHPPLFTAERKETRASRAGSEHRSMIKWEGEALLINTIVNGGTGTRHTQMDRWRLSRDGKTLRIRRQFVTMYGEVESELTYDRQPAASR